MQRGTIQDKIPQKRQNEFTSHTASKSDSYELKKTIVFYVLKNSLLESGEEIFEMVNRSLLEKYRCEISDCFEKPQYLSDVLKYVYDGSYPIVVESIKKNLSKFAHENGIKEFLKVLEASS